MLLFEYCAMMFSYVIALYVSFRSWDVHDLHLIYLPKLGVTWEDNAKTNPNETTPRRPTNRRRS
jgi:hypothetical protein